MEQQQSNIEQQCRDDPSILNYYTSNRGGIINNMEMENAREHEKQFKEEQLKMFKEKNKICHDLEKENEFLAEKSETATELENEVVKKLISSDQLMRNNVENLYLIRNVTQLCINDQVQSDELKQKLLDSFEKLIQKNYAREKAHKQKLSEMAEKLDNLNQQDSNNDEYFENLMKQHEEKKFKLQESIIGMQNQLEHTKRSIEENIQDIKTVTEEQNIMFHKFSELQMRFEEFNEQKTVEESEYSKTISNLNTTITNMDDKVLKLQNEVEDCKKGFRNRKEFQDQLKKEKVSSEERFSTFKIKCDEAEKEINYMKEQRLQEKLKDDMKINNLTKEIEELKQNNILLDEENKVLEKEFSEINIEENDLNSELINYEIYSKQIKNELKQEQDILEEQFDKFESEIATLKKVLNHEEQEVISLETERLELHAKFDKLNKEYEVVNLQNEAITVEAEVDEITINKHIDSVKSEISQVNLEIQEKQTKIKKYLSDEKEKVEKLERKCDEEINKQISEFEELKKELNESYQKDQLTKSDELNKLNENKITLELYISELKVSTENLHNELDMKINEAAKLQDELNNIKGSEAEFIDTSSLETHHHFKKPNYNFKIPKNKIPFSKYSSTSDSSGDEMALAKRRRVSFKRRTQDKKSVPSEKIFPKDSQKSIDDIFEALKANSGSENRPTRKRRTNRKAVF